MDGAVNIDQTTKWIVEITQGDTWYRGLCGREVEVHEGALYLSDGRAIDIWLMACDMKKAVKRFIRKDHAIICGKVE